MTSSLMITIAFATVLFLMTKTTRPYGLIGVAALFHFWPKTILALTVLTGLAMIGHRYQK